jgi:FKBP-type peptidyl-prolyl cis-trans isomerase FkpA
MTMIQNRLMMTLSLFLCLSSAANAADPTPGGGAIEEYVSRIVGTYSDGVLTLRAAQTPCDDFQACLYIELIKKGGELAPLRQQVWGLRQSSPDCVEAKVFGFPKSIFEPFMPSLANTMVGLWAAPDRFPRFDFDRLDLLGEAPVTSSDGVISLVSDEPFLLHRDGADSMILDVAIEDGAAHWRDELCNDMDVELPSLQAKLQRIDEPVQTVVTEEGLVMIDLRMGYGVELEAGDGALVHYEIYRMNGQRVESSRLPGRRPALMQPAPGRFFEGFQQGVIGMKAPARAPSPDKTHLRRLVVPSQLGFGTRGRAPIVKADEPLIVDLELVTLKDNTKKKK